MARTTTGSPEPSEEPKPKRSANPLGLVPISRFAPAAQPYLWDGLMPLGALTCISGAGGSYKSTLVTHLMAKLTVGELPGDFLGTPINVMYLTRENDPKRSMRPKIMAAGGDAERLFVLGGVKKLLLPESLPQLIAHAEATDTRVVVLDPMLAFLDQKRSMQGNYGYVVEILTELLSECSQRNITVIGISHLTKGKRKAEAETQVGSIGITTTARQVLMTGKTPDGLGIIATVKSNDGPTYNGWVFNVDHRPIGRDRKLKRIITAPFVELVRPAKKAEAKAMFDDVIDVIADARVQALMVYVSEHGVVETGIAQRFLMREFRIRDRQARTTISQAVSSGLLLRDTEGVGKDLRYKLVVSPSGERLLAETDDLPDAETDENFESLPDDDFGTFESFLESQFPDPDDD